MADKESKGLVFAKTVQKHAGRAKEKVRNCVELFGIDLVKCVNDAV
jgi:hypothetical protein